MELVAPVVLPFEVGNIFRKRLRRSASEAESIMAIWTAWSTSLPVRLVQPAPVHTMRLAHETGLTFYDASYLRLAQEQDADLITLDRQFVRVARSLGLHAPLPHTTPRSRN